MGLEISPCAIPVLDFSSDMKAREPGTQGWDNLCKQVRQACENYGCFQVVHENIPASFCQETFSVMKPLFELPLEIKNKNINPKPYYGYVGKSDIVPLYESFGFEDSTIDEAAQASTEVLWPDGNWDFCNSLHSMSKKLEDLDQIIRRMILESYGAEKYHDSMLESSNYVFRIMKYDAPLTSDTKIGLLAHTDKNLITILCQDEVGGLEVLSKQGHWVSLPPVPGSLVVFVGESFMAWSNNRLYAAKHRVMLAGDKERFSCGLFSIPNEATVIKVPEELVDEENPLLFKPFNFMDYLRYIYSDCGHLEPSVRTYAGL